MSVRPRPATTSPGWRLFQDWCSASDRPYLPTTAETIALFLADVPAAPSTALKRVQRIRTVHRDAGLPLALPTTEPLKPWREGRAWLSLGDTLNRIPLDGWPGGLVGRRDAFLAVLIGECGFSREQARAVKINDVVQGQDFQWSIAGRAVSRAADPGPCPACAVARWLGVLKVWDDWGRSSVRGSVFEYRRGPEHDCLATGETDGILVPTLLPAIDRHGWLADWEPMSVRSISAVLAYRQDAAQFPHDPLPLQSADGERPDYQRTSMQSLEDLLDDLDAKVEAALAKSRAIEEASRCA